MAMMKKEMEGFEKKSEVLSQDLDNFVKEQSQKLGVELDKESPIIKGLVLPLIGMSSFFQILTKNLAEKEGVPEEDAAKSQDEAKVEKEPCGSSHCCEDICFNYQEQ